MASKAFLWFHLAVYCIGFVAALRQRPGSYTKTREPWECAFSGAYTVAMVTWAAFSLWGAA